MIKSKYLTRSWTISSGIVDDTKIDHPVVEYVYLLSAHQVLYVLLYVRVLGKFVHYY